MTTTRPTRFAFVSAEMRDAFWREWREIDRRFPQLGEAPEGMDLDDHWRNLAALRSAARVELRDALRAATRQGFGGIYPIPV